VIAARAAQKQHEVVKLAAAERALYEVESD
jgi:hypothetical protein